MIRSFLALVLIVAGLPALGDEVRPTSSVFLVARPQLRDPNFEETVVLLTRLGPPGPMGVIVNRETGIALARVFPEIQRIATLDDKLFFGGPVEREVLVFVFRASAPREGAVEVLEGVYVSSSRELLRELLGRERPMEGLRVYAGHAAWAPGQLASEIARGDWRWTPADAKAIFERKPEALWPELNRRTSATAVRCDSCVQLDDVAVRERMLVPDLLALESRMAPDAGVSKGSLEILVDQPRDVAHGLAAP